MVRLVVSYDQLVVSWMYSLLFMYFFMYIFSIVVYGG